MESAFADEADELKHEAYSGTDTGLMPSLGVIRTIAGPFSTKSDNRGLTPAAGYIRSLATTAAGFQFASKRMVGTPMAGADCGVTFSSNNDIGDSSTSGAAVRYRFPSSPPTVKDSGLSTFSNKLGLLAAFTSSTPAGEAPLAAITRCLASDPASFGPDIHRQPGQYILGPRDSRHAGFIFSPVELAGTKPLIDGNR
jgi:hypothetical protein